MKRREGKGATSADLLVCFPTRAHLTLMPKTICSPARPSGPNRNSHNHQQYSHHHHHHHHHLRKSSTSSGGHVSPYLWSKTKQMGSDYSEPTSPKVTCAGQIKVRPRPGPCKSWQSVMEEIERLHNNKQKKRPTWVEALGFKKEMMQFLTCLRSVRFDFRCFGSFPNANVTSDDDEDEDDDHDDIDEDDHQQELDDQEGSSKAVFSKWFMVLQGNQNSGIQKAENCKDILEIRKSIDDPHQELPCGPPPNALLLMRCRSAPAKSWQEEKEEEEEEEEEEEADNDAEDIEKRKLEEESERKEKLVMEEEEEKEKENKKKRESLEELMRYESDFYKFSSDVAKETWVVGGIKDILSRSRSCKR